MDRDTKTTLVKTYDQYARERDESQLANWKLQQRENFVELVRKERKKTLLEIGAGTGKVSRFFQDNGLKVISTDISPVMIRLCQERRVPAILMDYYDLGFFQESFDAVWALNTLLHVPKRNLPKVLKEIQRVLKPAGLFYFGVFGGRDSEGLFENDFYTPKRFFSFYSDEKIKGIVRNWFTPVSFKVIPQKEGRPHFQSMILRNE